ncbi:hypothetical protein JTE90_014549 [Oedothorax gibbosus]|uniref:Uncharacterized protein n=1 Tax=Oedothorax gibbosus TaxID=931172 RepID=A0AAV6UD56_9ARAC|nr:hypothetical protein JTE90_014549 [Oedothorax gibbosus]
MANVFRISVVLAIVYLARFILTHELQTEEDRLDFDDFLVIEDSNENTLIQSEDSFEEDDRDVQSNEKVLIQSDDPFHDSQAAWFEEEYFLESNEDNMSDENVPIEFEISWPKEDKYAESNEYDPSKEDLLIKSGDPVRGRTTHQRAWPEEEKIVELNENYPSNDKASFKSRVPFGGRNIHHKAWPKEDKVVNEKNPSNEKVLIQSGAPLRGRTIHHTAWSEEEKIVVSNKEAAEQENVEKNIYDSWYLTKAFNYILSFIYDVEDDGAIVQSTAEDKKQTLKLQNGDFREIVLPQSQNKFDAKTKTLGNLSTYNQDKDSPRGTISAYSGNKDIKRLESESGDFDNDREYVDFEFVETLFEDKDYDQEDEFLNLFEDGRRFGAIQENPRKNIHPNLLKVTENYFQKNNENENMPKIKDKEHFQPSQVSEVNEKEVKVQETRNEAAAINEPTNSIEKPAAEEQSKAINAKPSINSNKKLKGVAVVNFVPIEDKQSNEDFFSQVENQNGEVLPGEKNSSQLELSEINNETTETIAELESYINYGTPGNYDETEFSQDKQKKSDFYTASNNINNKRKENANFDVESSIETTKTQVPQPSLPATESTQTTHDEMRKEDIYIKTKTLDPSTQKHFKLVSSTLVPKNLNKHKEQSFDFYQQVKNDKINLPLESNQESNHEVNTRHTIAQTKNEDPKLSPNVAGDTIVTAEQLNSKQNNETTVAQFQNIKSPRKPTKENGAEHSKSKTDLLRDLYPDFEVQENVASYNETNVAQFQNIKSPRKPTKENGAEHSKSKTDSLRDLYPDLEAQENVASYNYLLDSGEFIRVDGNSQNKVHKNQNNSSLLPVKDEKQDTFGKMTPILSKPAEPIDDQSKPEIFETILEYLYKHSNSTLLLSLREYNSSES